MGTRLVYMILRSISQKRIRNIQTPGNMSMTLGFDTTSCQERLLLSLQAPQEAQTFLLFPMYDSPSVAIRMEPLLAIQTLGLLKKKRLWILTFGEARQFSLPNPKNLLRLNPQWSVMRKSSHLCQEVGFASW